MSILQSIRGWIAARLDYQHVLLLLTAFVTIVGPDVDKLLKIGALPDSGWMKAVGLAAAALSLLKQFKSVEAGAADVSAVEKTLKLVPPAMLALGLFVGVSGCGAAQLTPQDKGELAQYAAEQAACIGANPGNQKAIDSCRAAVKARWDAVWNARFDGGF